MLQWQVRIDDDGDDDIGDDDNSVDHENDDHIFFCLYYFCDLTFKIYIINILIYTYIYIYVGSLVINGQLIENLEGYKNNIAYVPQDDIVHDDLSVEENIVYAALLFNKRGYVNAIEAIPMVLRSEVLLDISHIRTSVVGSPDKRGISGGQKKRVRWRINLFLYIFFLFVNCVSKSKYTKKKYIHT